MLNEKFKGEIQSVSAGIKTVKDENGERIKIGVYKVKLASADIDYESIKKFNPNISESLLNIQPMPFKGVDFGDQSLFRMKIDFYLPTGEDGIEPEDQEPSSFGNILIKKLLVKVVENIPIYTFMLELPMAYDGRFLFDNIKQRIIFEFGEMEKVK